MLPEYQSLLALPGTDSPVSYTGESDNDRWTNGKIASADGADQYEVCDGVAFLCPDKLDPWGDDASVKAQFERAGRKQSEVLKANYESVIHDESRHTIFGVDLQRISERGGVVVETAASQAVGFTPLLFHLKPDIRLIVTDPGHWVMAEWQQLGRSYDWPNAGFVQAALSALPFRSDSIDVLVSHNGYSGAVPGRTGTS